MELSTLALVDANVDSPTEPLPMPVATARDVIFYGCRPSSSPRAIGAASGAV